jgi:hypothetical protein
MERAQDSKFIFPKNQLAENAPVRRRQSQTTRNVFTISARETNWQKLATRSLVMTKISTHKMRAGQLLLLLERQTRRSSQRDHLCSDMFCSYNHLHLPSRSRYHSRMAQSAYKTTRKLCALHERPLAEHLGHGEGCCLTYSCFLFSYHSFCSSYHPQKVFA